MSPEERAHACWQPSRVPNALGIQRRDSGPCFPLTSAFGRRDQGIPRTHCHTVDSGFAPCLCRAQRHHSASSLHLRNACAPPLTAFPNPCINIIYGGCLGQNGLCNHLLEMFFQAYKDPHPQLVQHLLAGKHVRWQECYYIVLKTDLVG